MARTIVITDDLDGSSPASEVRFGWDDIWWVIDLSEDNRAKLQEALKPYLDNAHPPEREAPSPTRTRAARGTGGAKRTIPVEEYGFPRRGRTSADEQDYVRDHLDEVNKRLKAAGVREIDPSDPKMKDRYQL
jgi:Lsr2